MESKYAKNIKTIRKGGGGWALKTTGLCRKSECKKGGVKNNINMQELFKNLCTN